MYAVVTGDYCGEMLAFIETQNNAHHFLSIPKNENRSVPVDKFEFGLNNGVVETVEKMPRYVYALLEKQYMHNKRHK